MKPFYRVNGVHIVRLDDPGMPSAWTQLSTNSWAITISELFGSRDYGVDVLETDAGFEMYWNISEKVSHCALQARTRPEAFRIAREFLIDRIEECEALAHV